jgi:glycosyltransferase involved in cell wall biosynthesis
LSFPPPRVSVIVPCYNQGRYLAETIESVRAQRGGPELLVVDDGSSDDTASVARSYPGVRYLHQHNQGTAAARNQGWRASAGEYLLFLDADDRLLEGAVEVGVRELDAHPECGFVYGHVRQIDRDGRLLGTPPQDEAGMISYVDLLRHNSIWTPGSVLYRRAAVEEIGGFRSEAAGSADVDLNLRIARRRGVRCHGTVVLDYREYAESQSGDPGLMLRSAIWARRSQRSGLPAGSEALAALRQGISAARRYYGKRLARRVRREIAAGEWRGVAADLWTLLRYDPAGLPRVAGWRRS